jgi:hypothetical protein
MPAPPPRRRDLTGRAARPTLVAMLRALAVVLSFVALAACRRTHQPPMMPPPLSTAPAALPSAPPAPEPAAVAWRPPPAPSAPPAATRTVEGAALRNTNAFGPGDGGATLNGNPRGPRPEALEAVIKAALPSLQRCLDAVPALPSELHVQVNYNIQPTGRTSGVDVSGAPGADSANCIRGVIDTLRFPQFEGDVVSGSFPFTYRRQGQLAAPAQ